MTLGANDLIATAHPGGQFQHYLDRARQHPPIKVAVVHPCDPEAISAALETRDEGLFEPILVGPAAKINAAAAKAGLVIDGLEIEATAHSHAAAARAVELPPPAGWRHS